MKNLSKINSKGFTLIELLATIVILLVVLSITIYFGYNIINNANKKSYQATINNIEKIASTYVLENNSLVKWINSSDDSYQYQCVLVDDLIDTGYFSGDILNSKVDKEINVKRENIVYLERNINNKTITNSVLLVGDKVDFDKGLCDNVNNNVIGNNVLGNITFKVEPNGYSNEKKITIDYRISNNTDSLSNYVFSYEYDKIDDIKKSGNFSSETHQEVVTVNKNGKLTAQIKKGDISIISQIQVINQIVEDKPMCSISVTSSGIIMSVNDNVNITEKGLSTSNVPDYNGKTQLDLRKGKIYGYVKDAAGNTGSCSVDIVNTVYTCSIGATRTNNTIGCTTFNYDKASSSCPSGYTYSEDNCGREVIYTKLFKICRKDSNGYSFSDDISGVVLGLDSCTVEPGFICDASSVGKSYAYKCEKESESEIKGVIHCYKYSCSSGTLDGSNCKLYYKSSCDSGWNITNSYCSDSSYTRVSGKNYCYKTLQ